MQLHRVVSCPDLSAQHAQAHLGETMIQVDEYHVVALVGDAMIEGNWANLARIWMSQTLGALRPGPAQLRHLEHRSLGCAG